MEERLLKCLFLWLFSGIVCHLFYPIYYKESMTKRDWIIVLRSLPFYMFFGPFNLIFSFPI